MSTRAHLNSIANPWVERILRSPAHGLLSRHVLLLTCTGRRSGRRITVPVEYQRGDHGLSLRSRPEHRWWRNLRGGAPVTVRLRGAELGGFATVDESHLADGRVDVALTLASTEGQAQRRATECAPI